MQSSSRDVLRRNTAQPIAAKVRSVN